MHNAHDFIFIDPFDAIYWQEINGSGSLHQWVVCNGSIMAWTISPRVNL